MRYQNKSNLVIAAKLYQKKLFDRGINFAEIQQVPDLTYPTSEQIAELEVVAHIWKRGDRLYKLAHQYYNDPKLWWVISFFNKKPTEAHFDLGQTVRIPVPLDKVLDFIGY